VTEDEWLIEGLKESEEMSDEVEVAVRKWGVVIETAACRRRALTPRLGRSNRGKARLLGCGEAWATVGDRWNGSETIIDGFDRNMWVVQLFVRIAHVVTESMTRML
jgi:hypothetical protein